MDFYQIKERSSKAGIVEVYPDFRVCRSKDIMIRGKSFYAIWDAEKQMWSTDEYDVQRIVDNELMEYKNAVCGRTNGPVQVKLMSDFSSRSWVEFKNYTNHLSDNAHQLDERVTFSNTETKKKDYVSKRLEYPLEEGPCEAYEELISTLYEPEERAKIEWAIGAIFAGDAKEIEKFIALYGKPGTGKGTIINLIQTLFKGYCTTFEAKALGSSSSGNFATEVFKTNPLVAIQHDADLSRIEDNTLLNSIISHEDITMNEKHKPKYTGRVNAFLFIGTNTPIKISDAKSGMIRRTIDVHPSGRLIPVKRYRVLKSKIKFELGAIAYHCLQLYRSMGKDYYQNYIPIDMMFKTDIFFNFVEDSFYTFKEQDGVSLSQAFDMFKTFCNDCKIDKPMPRHKFREELKNYFARFDDITRIDGKQVRSYYSGFLTDKFTKKLEPVLNETPDALVLDQTESLLDDICADCPAQYASAKETPNKKWDDVTTKLSDIDTTKLHYMKLPVNHIVIDFDLKDDDGNKSAEKNIEAASKWPPTYAERSKGGNGIHLHYIYDGDPTRLSRIYGEGIEIKVFTGNSSLRRRLSLCNNIPIATINSGLPLKGEKMINYEVVKSEKALRNRIIKNLNKEIHPNTKPSVDYIYKILEDAYESGLKYDITDMRPAILAFANNSTNQADICLKLVAQMHFKSDEPSIDPQTYSDDTLVFYDVEVFPNLFLVNWKFAGPDKKCVRMINPTAQDIDGLFKFKLVGFNCRRYDNHIMYARYIGYTNEQLFKLSQRIVNDSRNCLFGEAYNMSYTDVYDFSSKKQSLKKWEIELGIHHQELGLPWDQPVPEDKWHLVAEYCDNDVIATEAVFNHLKADWTGRCILSELSGLTPNDTTQQHAAKIIFEGDPNPQDKFIYTDLSTMFPGYTFDHGKSLYRDEDPKEGGYVYAEPGMYSNVALLDVESMHPSSIELLDLFGPYTKNFSAIKKARVLIKHSNFEPVREMFNGRLAKYLSDESMAADLSYALKIIINIVYGLTSAKFDNKFKDPRNKDNIVAKRGALFMIDLKHAVQELGYTVAHIKTDSIKIPNADQKIIDFVMDFGKKYGYKFEHEATYSKMCLVNDAVYIAKVKEGKHAGEWTATGAQFAHPYIFKTLFSKEPLAFEDLCETRTVKSALYLDFNEDLPDVTEQEFVYNYKEGDKITKKQQALIESYKNTKPEDLLEEINKGHAYRFVGKAGAFCPVIPGTNGGILLREQDGKYYAAGGSKGYRWKEAEVVKELNLQDDIDLRYFNELADAAVNDISKFGDFEWFVSTDTDYINNTPCCNGDCNSCFECTHLNNDPFHMDCDLDYDITDVISKGEN